MTNNTSTKDMIRDTALELFKEQGYDNVSIMDICNKCEITKRTFYYHYESKAELLSGVVKYWGIQAERLLNTFASEEKSVNILWQMMKVYCDKSMQYGPNIVKQVYILTIQTAGVAHFPEEMYLFDVAVKLLKKAQNAGEIHNSYDPESIAFILYHTLRSISISWASEDGRYDLTAEYKKAFDIIVGIQDELFSPLKSRKQSQ